MRRRSGRLSRTERRSRRRSGRTRSFGKRSPRSPRSARRWRTARCGGRARRPLFYSLYLLFWWNAGGGKGDRGQDSSSPLPPWPPGPAQTCRGRAVSTLAGYRAARWPRRALWRPCQQIPLSRTRKRAAKARGFVFPLWGGGLSAWALPASCVRTCGASYTQLSRPARPRSGAGGEGGRWQGAAPSALLPCPPAFTSWFILGARPGLKRGLSPGPNVP